MNYKLISKNLEVTPAMEDMLAKKLSKLDRFFATDTAATVFMGMQKNRAKLEITVPVKNGSIRSEQTGPDIYSLMDDAVDSMEKQLKKYRSKLIDFYQSGNGKVYEPIGEAEEAPIQIVRTKRFAVKPMSPEEAILQMNLLGHNFFVFRNTDDAHTICVVYRRNSGGYGLIEAEEAD